MLRALYSSATGMKAQEYLIDVTSNNLANVNTNGFKRSQMDFADLMYSTIRAPGAEIANGQTSPIGFQIGSGVRPVGTTKNFSTGTIEPTGNPTDMAIEGQGFFEVTMPDGSFRYTRDGAFRVDANGMLVTGDGYPLSPQITIQDGAIDINVSPGGIVDGMLNGTRTTFGTITLNRFTNPAGLSSEGNNLFAVTAASGPAQTGQPQQNGYGAILGKFLEKSNVEVVTELISLITAQRAYEINSRAIRAGDEMLSTTTDIVR
ncbi:MAG: flagellar basal-body rod protein FlgG [Planctomycetales bacterium]|nr:flagellar basal-body rod protein FlgG [Planctomycetales bacterium]